jgi:hypothetical protein
MYNGFELSSPAKTSSDYRAELAGSVEDPGAFPGLQRVVRWRTRVSIGLCLKLARPQ